MYSIDLVELLFVVEFHELSSEIIIHDNAIHTYELYNHMCRKSKTLLSRGWLEVRTSFLHSRLGVGFS